ncbi:MAG: AI-2E family transporter [Treponema sp.]|jgi:predicted PurR-regulated permease PerM|nr:AI-2E family transporter [Treponema sp.]
MTKINGGAAGPENSSDRGDAKPIQALIFTAVLVILFILVCRLFAPFFTVLLWSILFYILLSPLHQRIVGKIDRAKLTGRIFRNIWAAVFSLGTVLLLLVPLVFVGIQFFHQVTALLHQARNYLGARQGLITDLLENISRIIDDLSAGQIVLNSEEMRIRIVSSVSSQLQDLLLFSSTVAMNVGSFFTGLVLIVFSLFFFYSDGDYLSRLALRVIPIRREYTGALVGKFKEITRNLVLGYIMVALVQGVIAFLVYALFKVSGSLVFAALTFFSAFIPIFGAGIIWFPLGLLRILNGDIAGGVVFWLVSGFFISTLDNFLRPIFLKDRIQLHPLIIFFAILGGISVFGLNGIILGPMVVILFLTVLDLFLTEHKIEQG